MRKVASYPAETHYFQATDYATVSSILSDLIDLSCRVAIQGDSTLNSTTANSAAILDTTTSSTVTLKATTLSSTLTAAATDAVNITLTSAAEASEMTSSATNISSTSAFYTRKIF